MTRNIILAYILNCLKHSWLWLGIWVFYYLQFTNYAGIGIIESVLVFSRVIIEVPTGAIADIFGKKTTIFLAFVFEAGFNLIMGFSQSLTHLVIAVLVGAIAGSLYSGSFEALVYDTLKQDNKEANYSKVNARIFSLQLLTLAISSVLGGFLYTVDPRLPFLTLSVISLIGALLSLLLIEPQIDTDKFSLTGFIKQNILGTKELFKNDKVKRLSIFLLTTSLFMLIGDEMLNDVLVVEFGFTSQLLGILAGVTFVLAAIASQLTPFMQKRIGNKSGLIVLSILVSITFLISPLVGLVVGGLMYILRYMLETIFYNLTSVSLNSTIESKYRATALSAFNMLKSIPYVFLAFALGYLMDLYTAKNFALALGLLLLIVVVSSSYVRTTIQRGK